MDASGRGAVILWLALACGWRDTDLGRWEPAPERGDRHCLVLEADGRFELVRRGGDVRPTAVVRGTWRRDAGDLVVTPDAIRTERFVSKCRKHVESAADHERLELLGVELALGVETKLAFRREGDALELCGTNCARLARVDAW